MQCGSSRIHSAHCCWAPGSGPVGGSAYWLGFSPCVASRPYWICHRSDPVTLAPASFASGFDSRLLFPCLIFSCCLARCGHPFLAGTTSARVSSPTVSSWLGDLTGTRSRFRAVSSGISLPIVGKGGGCLAPSRRKLAPPPPPILCPCALYQHTSRFDVGLLGSVAV